MLTSLNITMKQRIVVTLGQISYLVRFRVECNLTSHSGGDFKRVTPAVVVNWKEPDVNLRAMKAIFANFEELDDVYSADFLNDGLLLLQVSGSVKSISAEIQDFLQSRSTTLVFSRPEHPIPHGPYFSIGSELHQAWRLYADSLHAFVSSAIPDDSSSDVDGPRFEPLTQLASDGLHRAVAVPSRLYYASPTVQSPLAGMRLSIKDNMHLSGIITTLVSRSYTAFEGTQNETAEYVRSLVTKGAVIVGKTKLSAWAGSEVPANQCIDYFPPWNPRGDGYQNPSGSSSVAGASAAGYHGWTLRCAQRVCTHAQCLITSSDHGIATGSMRAPASSHGVWAHRLSWGTVPMSGVLSSVPSFDSIGVMARTPQKIEKILAATGFPSPKDMPMLQAFASRPAGDVVKPTRIIYPTDWYPLSDPGQQKMTELFIAAFEKYLGVQHTPLSFTEEWKHTAPEELRSITPAEFLEKSFFYVKYYDVVLSFDSFRAAYEFQYDSKPYTSPSHAVRDREGLEVVEQQRSKGSDDCAIFRSWVNEHILQVDSKGNSETIILMPHGRPSANYRDQDQPTPSRNDALHKGYSPLAFPIIAQIPQTVIPIGQSPYQSRVSGEEEYAPIVTTLAGAQGTDSLLLQIAFGALSEAGWPTMALTGRTMFSVADNDRHADVSEADGEDRKL